MHPKLIEFIRSARQVTNLADSIVVVTNGVLLHKMPALLWDLVSGIDVTLYPGVRLQIAFSEMVAKALEHNVQLRVRRRGMFRQTILNARIDSPRVAQTIFEACRIAHDYGCHSVYEGRYYKCSPAPYLQKRLRLTGRSAEGWEGDGVPLHNNPQVREDLERYLADGRALSSCSFCLGTSGRWVRHHQLDATGRRNWMLEDHSNTLALLDPRRLARVMG